MRGKVKNCFIYVRVSTKMQVENGESLEAQLYELRAYAKRENLKIEQEFVDDGYSGKNITGRPHFKDMMDAIRDGAQVDYVLVFKLSRFGRNAADALSSLQFMQDYGTNLVCVKDGINSEAQMGKMMIAFMAAFAEMERENILEQTMTGREQKARDGKWNGGQAPFGYRLVKDDKGKSHLVIDEEEAEIVRIIFDKFANKGMGVNSLSGWLNTHGYRKNLRGNGKYEHFTPNTLKTIIDNPVYIGKIAYGRRRVEAIKGTRNEYHRVKQDTYDIHEGEHDAIIDEELWNKSQDRRKSQSRPFPKKSNDKSHEHLLTGALICPVCGRHMVANVSMGKRKKDGTRGKATYAYMCKYSKKQFGPSCTFTRQFKQELVDKDVIDIIKAVSHSHVFEERIREEREDAVDIEKLQADVERMKKAMANNEAARKMLTRQMDKLDAFDASYEMKYEDMQRRLDKLYAEASAIGAELEDAEIKVKSVEENRVTTERVYQLLDVFEDEFDDLPEDKKKEVIHSIVDSIELNPDADPKKHERIVKKICFKCPVSFYHDLPESMRDLLGITQFNRLETTEYEFDENSRDKEDTVESVCLLSRVKEEVSKE